ncbi:Major facilitator superfamily protein [Mycena chlorophos]|uniref:Major facilitator superfamily protein n=1 Tax=Mycena chlorophos TaxID=658473 RepID=A0A8H6TBX4_MYCCL|nr:Major facilitator superfamily protein [Mycena chlorophos]
MSQTSLSESKTPQPPAAYDAEAYILTGRRLLVVFPAMLLSILLIALDQTILATALPRIASDFGAFSLQGWVSSAFVLAQTVFVPFFGQNIRLFPAKWILVYGIVTFEVGSLVCGVAHSANQLIAGRAVSGMGAAAIYVATIQILAQATRLENRPRMFAALGSVFAVSSIVGPLVGGAFTQKVSWRWCFYVNLPIGGVSLLAVLLLLKAAPPMGVDPEVAKHPWAAALRRIDWIGAVLIAGTVTTLMLSLQWGGNTKPWGDKDVIICFVFAGVLAVVFVLWQRRKGDTALIPPAIFHSVSMYAIIFYCMLTRFSLLIFSYYIPIFYQADRNYSALRSGVDLLPFSMGGVFSIIGSAQITSRTGYYWMWLVISPLFLALGSGLLYTVSSSTSSGTIVGFQILAGIGTGLSMQSTLLAIQAEFRGPAHAVLLGQATAAGTFAQFLGGTLGLGVAEPVFASRLAAALPAGLPAALLQIVRESPTAIHTELPAEFVGEVVRAYNAALKVVFILGVPIAGLGLGASVWIRNINIKPVPPLGKDVEAGEEKGETDTVVVSPTVEEVQK